MEHIKNSIKRNMEKLKKESGFTASFERKKALEETERPLSEKQIELNEIFNRIKNHCEG